MIFTGTASLQWRIKPFMSAVGEVKISVNKSRFSNSSPQDYRVWI